METLQFLANCYKHSPSQDPDSKLLRHLGLDVGVNYAPLPESSYFREGLAAKLELPKDADYCDIADRLLQHTEQFLANVREQNGPRLSRVRASKLVTSSTEFAR